MAKTGTNESKVYCRICILSMGKRENRTELLSEKYQKYIVGAAPFHGKNRN
jgi:hypothetical protein